MFFLVTPDPLDPQQAVELVRRHEAGAVLVFLGVVRSQNLGRQVIRLQYEAYPEMAEQVMRELAQEAVARFQLTDVAIMHRTGVLPVGETSLVVAVSSPHRHQAFQGGQWLVNRLKERLPIWKKETFVGGEEWIEGELPPAG